MKIFTIDKVREADQYTITNEPISSIDLMERASVQLSRWVKKHVKSKKNIKIFTGLGNNGGDGLALGRLLYESGYEIDIYIIRYSEKTSADFEINYSRILENGKIKVFNIYNHEEFPEISKNDVIVDSIFGSGLTRPTTGFIAQIINNINKSSAIVISIDIPSGLMADSTSMEGKGEIIHADYTLTFQFPKLAFLQPENDAYVGNWEILDIGLHHDYINKTPTKNYFIVKEDVAPIIRGRAKFSHKGTYGHAMIIAGSYGKMGAAVLASMACLKSGVGLLHTHIPIAGIEILQTSVPETMLSIDRNDHYFSDIPDINHYSAIGIGPGLGTEHQSQKAFKLLIQNTKCPMVIDADALNILSLNPTWIPFLPPNSILTPHPKEFKRLVGGWNNDFEKMEKQRHMAQKHGLYIVLKGAYTSVCFPDGSMYFNSTGNPGMATAGSGDVLTGIITGLLASGYSAGHAAILGTFIHGLAGDFASNKLGYEAVIASDIIRKIGKAFKTLNK